MKKFLIAAATLATAVSAAAPAAAQWFPQRQPQYGYATQYGNGYSQYGYGNGSQLQQRVQMVRREIRQLDRSNRLSEREARQLDRQAQFLEQRIQRLAYGGVNPNERYYVERQIAQLESQVRREANDGNGWYGQNRAYGYNSYGNNGYGYNNGYNSQYGYPDRDRDGRDDRREDDRGNQHDD